MKKSNWILIGVGIALIVIHFVLNSFALNQELKTENLENSYSVLILFSCFLIFVGLRIRDKHNDKVGFLFLGSILLKMIGSVAFLWPHLKPVSDKVVISHFFVAFFILLFIEAVVFIGLLKDEKPIISE